MTLVTTKPNCSPGELAASYAICQKQARAARSSFYYPFFLLPRPKRQAMFALYAFLRQVDDIADQPAPLSERQARLDELRETLQQAFAGDYRSPIMPALHDMVTRYPMSPDYLLGAIDGAEMDLDGRTYETFEQLQDYCHHVASFVGLACIHIWGFRDDRAYDPAIACGLAFQLTNILRDLAEDAAAGRIYLPSQDLAMHGYTAEQLKRGERTPGLAALIAYEVARAEAAYADAAPLAGYLDPDGRRIFLAMTGIYRGLLDEVKRRGPEVLASRVRLPKHKKLWLAGRAIWRGAAIRP